MEMNVSIVCVFSNSALAEAVSPNYLTETSLSKADPADAGTEQRAGALLTKTNGS